MVDRYSTRYSRNPHYTSSNNPSFSSTLLDAVYRSIDDNASDENIQIYHKPMRKKHNYTSITRTEFKSEQAMANFQRACMIEKWMDKKTEIRTNLVSDIQKRKSRKDRETSSSSSSDFSCSGGNFFSSSEPESFPVQRPKPVRTENLAKTDELKLKQDSGFVKTKAMKFYDDLKKVKQPISPGGKLAGFLNSLFNNGNVKRSKTNNGDDSPSLTCSSASSFSRSCLSKTPSSAGKSLSSVKRSVRFFVDEDCGQKALHEESNNHYNNLKNNNDYIKSGNRNVVNEELMVHVLEKNRRVEEVARDLLRNYQKKVHVFERELDDDDDDDAASYASSDLFELDNLSVIGMDKYREELPVYETTRLY